MIGGGNHGTTIPYRIFKWAWDSLALAWKALYDGMVKSPSILTQFFSFVIAIAFAWQMIWFASWCFNFFLNIVGYATILLDMIVGVGKILYGLTAQPERVRSVLDEAYKFVNPNDGNKILKTFYDTLNNDTALVQRDIKMKTVGRLNLWG